MARILVLGAGVMGSAVTVPAADNGHAVTIVGTPLDAEIIAALKSDPRGHPRLRAPLADSIEPLYFDELSTDHFNSADLVIVGVSSAGVEWAKDCLSAFLPNGKPIALVTKGLMPDGAAPPTNYVDASSAALGRRGRDAVPVIGIGGPCIARELALRHPTAVVFASREIAAARGFAELMRTPYYRIEVSTDVPGVESCAALKNFYAIGVSAMRTRHPDSGPAGYAMNPIAAAFNQAVREIALLSAWMGGERETAFDLAGLGDLHVTVGGGRNSRLGVALGRGLTVSEALNGDLKGETVEGVDTGRNLAPGLRAAFAAGRLNPADFPLGSALLEAIVEGRRFQLDFAQLHANG
jgi:glycerol-3-phosphate dehydrogenase (NAD(P)+)